MIAPRVAALLVSAAILAPAGAGIAAAGKGSAPRRPAGVPEGLPQATRGPVRLAVSPDGSRIVVSEADAGVVTWLDAASGRIVGSRSSGGEHPEGLALLPGGRVLVANRQSGSLALLEPPGTPGRGRDGSARQSRPNGSGRPDRPAGFLALPGEPTDLEVDPTGTVVYVSLAALDQVVAVALPELIVRARIPVGSRPGAMAMSRDGRRLLVANFRGGDVSLVDTRAAVETRRIHLTGVNLRGIDLSPDESLAFVTGQIAANDRITRDPLDIWTNTLFAFEPGSGSPGSEGWLDFSGAPCPDPDEVVALERERVLITVPGADELILARTQGPYLRSYDPTILKRARTGFQPRGLAVSQDGRRAWVATHLGNTLEEYDTASLRRLRTIPLGTAPRPDPALPGRYLFGSANLTRGRQFTCASCHPDGGTDGLVWKFAHVPDGLERRNTRSLRGGLAATAPFRWTGRERDLHDFLQDEVSGLLGTSSPDPASLAALQEFLAGLKPASNPYRDPSGRLSPPAAEGKRLFEGKAGCAGCHGGAMAGGTGQRAWVGTTEIGLDLDVPHLRDVHSSAPYLHDGSAATLEEVLRKRGPRQLHGSTGDLLPGELEALLQYLRAL